MPVVPWVGAILTDDTVGGTLSARFRSVPGSVFFVFVQAGPR